MEKPLLSILCPSYNHEKFVGYFINSLLQQTNPNWELIIVDDCSTDNNVAEIKKYKDKRIKFFQNPFNMGVNCSLNKAFSESSGQYISFCASDDMLCSDYVQNVFDAFEQKTDKGVLYCDLQLIDNQNKLKNSIWRNFRSDRYSVLYNLFVFGNCMLSPGMVVKRELFKKIYPLNIPLSQYQDYKMHIDLLLNSDFMVMDKISVLYRKNDAHSGLSACSEATTTAQQLETNLLMNSFLKIQDTKLLEKIFKSDINKFKPVSKDIIPYVLGTLALQSPDRYKKIWGYNQIVHYINMPKNYETLNKKYNFCYHDFLNIVNSFSSELSVKKYRKYKKLFNYCCIFLFVFMITIIIGFLN